MLEAFIERMREIWFNIDVGLQYISFRKSILSELMMYEVVKACLENQDVNLTHH